MPFVKLDCGILDSSIWVEPSDTRICWITLLAMATADGLVESTAPGISRKACISIEATRVALAVFESPDGDSRSFDDGRRIERVDGGYQILNYQKYREKDYTAAKRAKKYRDNKSSHRNACDETVTVTQAEAEAEAYTEGENLFPVPTNGNGRPKKSPKVDDPRHSQFRAMIEAAYLKVNGVQCPWSGAEGAQLKRTISACPSLDNPTFKKLLLNYFNSEDHPRGDRPSKFLPRIFSYTTVLTKFKTEETNPDACRFE